MARLLQLVLLIVLAFIAWRLLRQWLRGWLAPGEPTDSASNDARFEPTARCEKCGTHVPRTELDTASLCPKCRPPAP